MWIDEPDLEAVDDDEAAAAGLRAEVEAEDEAGVVDEVLVVVDEEEGFEARDGVEDCGVACRLGAISLPFLEFFSRRGERDERQSFVFLFFFFFSRRGDLGYTKKQRSSGKDCEDGGGRSRGNVQRVGR